MRYSWFILPLLCMGCPYLTAEEKPKIGDWPQWGGTDDRNMVSDEKGLPTHFEVGKPKAGSEEIDLATTKNVKWVLKLGSQTYGNPTVAGGRVFIGTNNESPRDERIKGDRGIVMCFDEKSGAFLWQLAAPKLKSGKVNDWEFLGIMSSPLVIGERLYLVTNRCEVLCLDVNGMANGNDGLFKDEVLYLEDPDYLLDAARIERAKKLLEEKKKKGEKVLDPGLKDADIIWRYDMMMELGIFPHNASNCSILAHDKFLYVNTSNGQDWSHMNIPSETAPSYIVLSMDEGIQETDKRLVGEDDIKQGPRILHGLWSNPSKGKVGGQAMIFFGGGDGFLYAFDSVPQTEQDGRSILKDVWRLDCNPLQYRVKDGKKLKYPHHDGPSEIDSTPVFYKERVYVAIGQDPEHGPGLGNLLCIDAKTGKQIWANDKIMRSISTVAIKDGLLFIGDFSGNVYCFDAEDGKQYWKHATGSHIWGSPFAADGKVYIGNEEGDLYVFALSKEKKILNADQDGKVSNFGSAMYSTPIAANGVLYVSTQTHLYALEEKK